MEQLYLFLVHFVSGGTELDHFGSFVQVRRGYRRIEPILVDHPAASDVCFAAHDFLTYGIYGECAKRAG
ncbi:hypothetical protein D3C81_1868620 [compost metagenome]